MTGWTVDAVFRETAAEARQHRDEGVVTVEMEAAALFAVGAPRDVAVTSAFVVSDHVLADERWMRDFHGASVDDGTFALLDAAIELLGTVDALE